MDSQQRLFCLLWGISHLQTADPQQLSGHQLSGQQVAGQQLSSQQLSGHQLSAGALPGISDRPAFTNSPANYSVTQGNHHGEEL
jgi:hypothetical protein